MTELTKDVITDNEKARQVVAREMLKFRGVEHHTLEVNKLLGDLHQVVIDLSVYTLGVSRKVILPVNVKVDTERVSVSIYVSLKQHIQELVMSYFTQENNKNAE